MQLMQSFKRNFATGMRQLSIRQQTTTDRAGTHPLHAYAKTPTTPTPLDLLNFNATTLESVSTPVSVTEVSFFEGTVPGEQFYCLAQVTGARKKWTKMLALLAYALATVQKMMTWCTAKYL